MIVYGDGVGQWVAAQNGGRFAAGAGQALGLQRNGQLAAGCLFENFCGRSMVAHLAIRGRITPEFLWVLADYTFRQMKVYKLIAPVDSENAAMMRLARKMGFVEETRIREASPRGDIVIWTMTAAQCRFLGDKYHGEATATRPA